MADEDDTPTVRTQPLRVALGMLDATKQKHEPGCKCSQCKGVPTMDEIKSTKRRS